MSNTEEELIQKKTREIERETKELASMGRRKWLASRGKQKEKKQTGKYSRSKIWSDTLLEDRRLVKNYLTKEMSSNSCGDFWI